VQRTPQDKREKEKGPVWPASQDPGVV